ncbi:hypothetical protein [Clostridium sp.]|uniref:hypothetical protein n=1 Tax=Clostridium sp. TaxID=1506 RepID=UPI003D6D2CBA
MQIYFSTFLESNNIKGIINKKLSKLDKFFEASYGNYGNRCHLKDKDLEAHSATESGKLIIKKYAYAHFIVNNNDLFISNRVSQSGGKICTTETFDTFYDSIPGASQNIKDRSGKKVTEDNVDLIIAGIMIDYAEMLRKVYVTK